MSVRYTRRALADVASILAYISKDNPRAAETVRLRLIEAIEGLQQFPLMGRPTDEPGVRVLTMARYPYLIFYRVIGERDIEVVRALHGARLETRR